MGTAVPLTLAALGSGAALVAPTTRVRAYAMLFALVLIPVLLIAHVSGSKQLDPILDRPLLAAAAGVAGLVLVGGLAALFHRRPALLALAAVAALPFRIPLAIGGSTSNLLVPLYLVIAAGALAWAVPRIRTAVTDDDLAPAGTVEWALAAIIVLYTAQSAYSIDTDKALENAAFFYLPFTLLFALLVQLPWNRRLVTQCLGVLVVLSLIFVAIGAVEYETRHILLNPKVIASNQFESYFRVNSLFFDPNIYGRFLATVMIFLAAVLLWARRPLVLAGTAVLLAVLWGGLLLTFSQTSFAALAVGLAVLGGLRWSPRMAAIGSGVVAIAAIVFVVASPGTLHLKHSSADDATSGRADLVQGGIDLFKDAPLVGHGSGSFSREYRRAEKASSERAVSASHTVPVTIAAEQGIVGLIAYVLLLGAAFLRLFRGASSGPMRAGIAAAFAGLVLHTMGYAAFLEDPITWALLGAGTAFARLAAQRREST